MVQIDRAIRSEKLFDRALSGVATYLLGERPVFWIKRAGVDGNPPVTADLVLKSSSSKFEERSPYVM